MTNMENLGDIAELTVGYPFKSKLFTTDPSGPRLLKGDNIVQGRTRWDRTDFWPSHEEVDPQYHLAPGDVVVAMDRPWIEAGLKYAAIDPEDLPALLVQRVARLRAKQGTDQKYLRYLVGGPGFTEHILSAQTGTAVPHVSGRQILAYRVPPRQLEEQRAIAEVLGALDDKIAANVRVVAAADRLASAELSRMLCQDEPQSVPLTRAAEFVNGKAFTKDATGTGRMVIRIAELNSGPGGSTVYNDLDVEEKHLAGPGDLLFAWSGSLTVNRWFRDEGIVNQHIFKVIPKSGYPLWCVDAVLRRKLEEFRAIAADKATTMGHIQRRHLDEGAQFPSAREIKECDPLMQGLWERALSAERESLRLAELRGALLPALMSGRLRVKDAEKAMGEAV